MIYITEAIQSLELMYSSEYVASGTYFSSNYFAYFGGLPKLDRKHMEIMGISSNPAIAINVEVRIMIMPTQNQQDVSLMGNVISSLLQNRDFLGYQLSYYKGNLTEEQFNIIKNEYLTPNNIYNVDSLATNVFSLMKNTSIVFDADQISTIFRCDIDVAENALTKIINTLNA